MNINHLLDRFSIDTLGFYFNVENVELPTNVEVNGKAIASSGRLISKFGKPSLRVKHVKKHNRLYIEGSHDMHFTGQNICGSNHALEKAVAMVRAVKDAYGIPISLWDAYNIIGGWSLYVNRTDTPTMLRLPAGLTPAMTVNALALAGLRCGLNVSLYRGETFYFDQHSQSVALKGYLKDVEMAKQRKRAELPDTANVAQALKLAHSTVRLEFVFRQKYLKARFNDVLPTARDLSPWVLGGMISDQFRKYDLRGNLRTFVREEDLWAIFPRALRATVVMWQRGYDMLKYFDNDRRALAHHRRELLSKYSIDINERPPTEMDTNVELGDLLRVENFVSVPDAIRQDPQLFHNFDLYKEWKSVRGHRKGISHVYVDPYADDAALHPEYVPQLMDVDF